jgi:preprotein translocase subunit SecE
METQNQKWVFASYLLLAFLVYFVVFAGGTYLAGMFDLETKVRNIELIVRIGAIVLGGALFLGLVKNERSNTFMSEVVLELSRVTWPTQKETVSATFIVIVMVLISGVVLWFFDSLWTTLLQYILQ